MKKTLLLLSLVALIGATSCQKEEKTIVTNSRGVPMTVADIIMGDKYAIDTLYSGTDNSVIYIDNPDYTQHIIYTGEEVLLNAPAMDIDSLAHSVYQISDMVRSVKVNFGSAESIAKLRRTFPQYPEFSTVVVSDTSRTGQPAVFAYVVNVPDDKVKNHEDISRWIEKSLSDTAPFNASIRAFGQQLERDFFHEWEKRESDFIYTTSRSMLVYEMTPEYITYNDFFWGFLGGAHGMTCNRFLTYLPQENRPLTADYLFEPDSEDAVRELIYEALAADEDFMAAHKITSLSQARTYVQRYLDGEKLPIPDPAFLTEGVVFCYQPYEIGCYADGLFQLIVPYSKISQYFAVNPLIKK